MNVYIFLLLVPFVASVESDAMFSLLGAGSKLSFVGPQHDNAAVAFHALRQILEATAMHQDLFPCSPYSNEFRNEIMTTPVESYFGTPGKIAAATGSVALLGGIWAKGYSLFAGTKTIVTGVSKISDVAQQAIDQREEEISAIKRLADQTEAFRKIEEAKNAKAEEALDHVNDLSLMELHILAAAESQTKSDSHYWQDLYNAKRGGNPFLAISSNNLDDNKQPENPNQN